MGAAIVAHPTLPNVLDALCHMMVKEVSDPGIFEGVHVIRTRRFTVTPYGPIVYLIAIGPVRD